MTTITAPAATTMVTTMSTVTATSMATITPDRDRPMLASAEAARLLLWFSPSFPTGAFGFSHGLEWAVEIGDVADRATLEAWIGAVLAHGAGWTDAVLIAAAHDAARGADDAALVAVAELAAALQPSRERRLESTVQGEAFLRAVETAWPNAACARLRAAWDGPIALPVAIGVAAAGEGLGREAVIAAAMTGFAANLVSAAIRLAPIGQSDGLRVMAALEPLIRRLAPGAAAAGLGELGGCALRADIASMRHETQATRLFRS
ncbi:urease accessory protein UreF [Labrys wisconsinensis]|nr:urease accessory UreF family protein [Labrys wisconsinensis]